MWGDICQGGESGAEYEYEYEYAYVGDGETRNYDVRNYGKKVCMHMVREGQSNARLYLAGKELQREAI